MNTVNPFTGPVGSLYDANAIRGNDNGLVTVLNATNAGVYNIRNPAFGAKGDGSDDGPALLRAIDAAENDSPGATVVMPRGSYTSMTEIPVPPTINLIGGGMWQTTITFPNGTDGFVLEPSVIDTLGARWADFRVVGDSHASTSGGTVGIGLKIKNIAHMTLDRVRSVSWALHVMRCQDFDHVMLNDCFMGGGGEISGLTASVKLDTTPGSVFTSNGFYAHNLWVQGGGTACVEIDRVLMAHWLGGNCESAPIPLKIGSNGDGSDGRYCQNITIDTVDFENATTGGRYIEIGTGWTAGGYGVRGVQLRNCNMSISGGTPTRGIVAKNTSGLVVTSPFVNLTGAGVAAIDLQGANNTGYLLGAAAQASLSGGVWLRKNGVDTAAVSTDFITDTAWTVY